ncbi:MAG: NAD(P)H-hydrate epimerase [Clostridia bacterium]|nr:NAD(P)H-hydrate epimerase [Clostridia bacterium]
MKILLPQEMKRMDQRTVEEGVLSSLELMQNAAEALYKEVEALMNQQGYERVLLLAGNGNNGGDAYALACLLYPQYAPAILRVGEGEMSPDCRHYYDKAKELGIPFVKDPEGYPLVVEGVFGTGFHGALPQDVKALFDRIDAPVVAIDLPGGMDGASGIPAEGTLKPVLTVTFAYKKPCHLFSDCGKVVVADIGIPKSYADDMMLEELECAISPREEWGHKSSFGDVGLLVGCARYSGAAALALLGALKSGVGLIYGYLPAVPRKAAAAKFYGPILKSPAAVRSDFRSIWLAGSGLGRGISAGRRMHYLWKNAPALVVDGDGLWHIREALSSRKGYLTVLTPHLGEFASLLGVSVEALKKDRLQLAAAFAKKHQVILVLKDAATLVTDGSRTAILSKPCSALSRGGSGDLLAGLIAGLLASDFQADPFEGVKCGVWLHNRGAHLACKDHSPRTLQPEIIAEYIDQAFKELE